MTAAKHPNSRETIPGWLEAIWSSNWVPAAESWTLAAVTGTSRRRPIVSVTMLCLRPTIFLPASVPWVVAGRLVEVFTLCASITQADGCVFRPSFGIFGRLNGLLRRLVREAEGRDAEPSACVLDAQSVKTSANVPAAGQGILRRGEHGPRPGRPLAGGRRLIPGAYDTRTVRRGGGLDP